LINADTTREKHRVKDSTVGA